MPPEALTISKDRALLHATWPDRSFAIPAKALRVAARDAVSVRERHDNGTVMVPPDITITGVEMVGAMGVNVIFSDGHDRAIFPWAYLREIALAQDSRETE